MLSSKNDFGSTLSFLVLLNYFLQKHLLPTYLATHNIMQAMWSSWSKVGHHRELKEIDVKCSSSPRLSLIWYGMNDFSLDMKFFMRFDLFFDQIDVLVVKFVACEMDNQGSRGGVRVCFLLPPGMAWSSVRYWIQVQIEFNWGKAVIHLISFDYLFDHFQYFSCLINFLMI